LILLFFPRRSNFGGCFRRFLGQASPPPAPPLWRQPPQTLALRAIVFDGCRGLFLPFFFSWGPPFSFPLSFDGQLARPFPWVCGRRLLPCSDCIKETFVRHVFSLEVRSPFYLPSYLLGDLFFGRWPHPLFTSYIRVLLLPSSGEIHLLLRFGFVFSFFGGIFGFFLPNFPRLWQRRCFRHQEFLPPSLCTSPFLWPRTQVQVGFSCFFRGPFFSFPIRRRFTLEIRATMSGPSLFPSRFVSVGQNFPLRKHGGLPRCLFFWRKLHFFDRNRCVFPVFARWRGRSFWGRLAEGPPPCLGFWGRNEGSFIRLPPVKNTTSLFFLLHLFPRVFFRAPLGWLFDFPLLCNGRNVCVLG